MDPRLPPTSTDPRMDGARRRRQPGLPGGRSGSRELGDLDEGARHDLHRFLTVGTVVHRQALAAVHGAAESGRADVVLGVAVGQGDTGRSGHGDGRRNEDGLRILSHFYAPGNFSHTIMAKGDRRRPSTCLKVAEIRPNDNIKPTKSQGFGRFFG